MFKLCPQDLGVILTYRCHSGCAHCLYNCGPRWPNEAMSFQDLRQALEAVTLWPRPPQVHLTGGEPFLHFDLLLEGARIATELGIVAYVETNGSWCIDEGQAVEKFQALRQAGLQAVLVSCSPFHAEHIPPARTMQAIRAAMRVFGSSRVIVYQAEFLELLHHFDAERPTPLAEYEATFGLEGARRILWEGYGIIPGGRAGYSLGHLVLRRPPSAFAAANCASELLYAPHSHFDLHGHFVPAFCGGLTLGSWRELPQLLDDFQIDRYPLLIATLVKRGPFGLFELAQQEHGYVPLADGYAGKCHLCVDVRRCLVQHADFLELAPRGFYQNL